MTSRAAKTQAAKDDAFKLVIPAKAAIQLFADWGWSQTVDSADARPVSVLINYRNRATYFFFFGRTYNTRLWSSIW